MALDNAPERVREADAYLCQHGLWHVLSRNSRATSCRDAAARRRRLGTEGIPLFDELKSLCVVIYRPQGRQYGLLHCRAHSRFDLDAARKILGADRPLARLSAEELRHKFQMEYGTVNPFSKTSQFVQIFDEGLGTRYTPPHTMMTNAGDFEWALEFRPEEVIAAVSQVTETLVGRITREPDRPHQLPSFGIITGNGPESGIALWQHINDSVCHKLTEQGRMHGDLSYPKVMIHSLPEMGLSMELAEREDEVWHVIEEGVRQLCAAGIRYIALACNTTQYFGDRIQTIAKAAGADFISMATVTMAHIHKQGIRDLTIIGIPVVATLGEYSAYQSLRDLDVQPVQDIAKPKLQELGYLVKRIGRQDRDARAVNMLRDVLKAGVLTDRVLIALTEISVLLQRFPKMSAQMGGKTIIDPLRLYGEALAELYLDALPQWDENDPDDQQDDINPDDIVGSF